MFRPLLSILGLLVLLATPATGSTAPIMQPMDATATAPALSAPLASAVTGPLTPPVEGGQPYDPAVLRPDQPYPGAGYPGQRVTRAALAGWSPAAAPPPGIDLDVTFISRAPMYRSYCVEYPNDVPGIPILCPGTEEERRWPAAGEVVTFTAHIANKGMLPSPPVAFKWLIDGSEVASGTLPGPAPGGQVTAAYVWSWAHKMDGERVLDNHTVRFVVDPANLVPETFEANNSLEDRTNALGFRIGVTPEMIAAYNSPWLPGLSFSAEDWLQRQIAAMNWVFANSIYTTTSGGATERVRINSIEVTPTPPVNDRASDGGWFVDADYRIVSAWYDPTTDIDWALVHELSHQVGVIDLYQLNLSSLNVKVLDREKLPANFGFDWPRPDLMGGGDIAPHTDSHLYSSHGAAGFSSTKGYRRGYYGEYQFDIPRENTIRVLDSQGDPAAGVEVSLYQRNGPVMWPSEVTVDVTPEFTGMTDGEGRVRLANRQIIGGPWATRTGHVLRDNPFGVVDIIGGRNRFLVKLTNETHEEFGWLDITDFNLAYWAGDTESHTFTVKSHVPPPAAPAPPGGLAAQLAAGRVTLNWNGTAIPEVNGYYVYAAAAPTYAYEKISDRVIGTSYVIDYNDKDRIYVVTAVDLDGRESGFSRTAWVPVLVTPSAVIVPEDERLILDTHVGPLIRQDGGDRYLGRLGQHFGDTGDRYLAADAGGRLLVTSPERQTVRVSDPDRQPLFEFGSEGIGHGQFRGPTGVAAWGLSCSVEGPLTSDAHTLLLLHFDISFTGADGEIGTPHSAGFAEGRYSGGLYIDHTDTLTYETAGTLNRAQGAIEFWVQPRWEGSDGENHVFFEAGTEWFNRIMITKDGANNLRLITWDSAHEYGVGYGIGDWRAGEWHHVAATWDASTLALYVDGQRRDWTGNARPPDALAAWFSIGSTAAGGSQADAVIDEFRISDAPRVGNSDTCSRILVADSGNDRIQAFDALGGFVSAYGSTGSGPGQFRDPQGLAVDDGGRVIVADRGNNRLQLLSFDGVNFSGLFDVRGLFNGPIGVAAYGSDSILVADTGNNAIKRVIPHEHLPIIEELPMDQQGQLNAPRGVVASGSDGSVVVADTGNRRIVTLRGALPTLTPTPFVTPTPTPILTPPTAVPACQQLVTNGDFEKDEAWDFPVTASRAGYATAEAHSGARSARLGLLPWQPPPELGKSDRPERNLLGEAAPDNASFSAVHQPIGIPPSAGSVTLSFWYKPGTQAAGGDYQRVMLLDPAGYTYIATLMQVLENSDSWRRATFDLTPYRGRQVVLYFEVFNDNISAGPRTWMFLDDVSVSACSVTPPWTPTPTPSPTPGGDLTVTGLVYDASIGRERPIGGATVSAQMCNPRFFETLTGPDGRYSLLIPGNVRAACTEITLNAWAPDYSATGWRILVEELRQHPEFDFELSPLISVTTTDDELNADGDCSLREAIQAVNTGHSVDGCTLHATSQAASADHSANAGPAGGGGYILVVLPSGTYSLTLAGAGDDANFTGDLDITGNVRLIGAGMKATVLDGAGLDRVLDVHGGASVEIGSVMITGGRTPNGLASPTGGGNADHGGGIANAGGLSLTGCGISGNHTGNGGDLTSGNYVGGPPGGNGGNGGGIYNAGALYLYDTWVAHNATGGGGMGGDSAGPGLAGAGGGIYNTGMLNLDRATVEANNAGMGGTRVLLPGSEGGPGGDGGGIYNAGDAAIARSSVADNYAGNGQSAGTHGGGGIGGAGGGIYNKGELLLHQSIVSGNTSGAGGSAEVCAAGGHGGGIAGTNGALRLANSTVSGNRTGAGGLSFTSGRCAGGDGGGIYVVYGAGLDNTTIAANHTNGAGGGFFIVEQYVSLRNTILAGNTASEKGPNCAGNGVWSSLHLIGHNLTQDHTGCLAIMDPADGPNIIGKDPLLLPLGKYGGPTLTHALSPGSPAIDAGSCTDMRGDPVTEDQRGVLRPQGATCDIGAFERGAFEGSAATLYLPLVLRAQNGGSVTLLYFRAAPQNDNAILLEWETATELDTVAFNLYRSQDLASLGQLLVTRPAQGDGPTGAAYSHRDGNVQPGVLYYYTLQQITSSGELITIATASAGIGLSKQTSTPTPTPTIPPVPTRRPTPTPG